MVNNIITGLQQSIVQSIKNTQRIIDKTQLALATGKDVNSVIDDAQSFFGAKALSNRAADFSKLLDEISLSIRSVEETQIGIKAILSLLDQAEALVEEARLALFSDLSAIIDVDTVLNANPSVIYNADTDSFYQFINTPQRIADAINNANATIIEGVSGHIVNITSQVENDFIDALTGNLVTWIGASDAGTEGRWEWIGGSEAGLNFWNGDETGTAVPGTYNNWRSVDPDDGGIGQDFAIMLANGQWDDFGPPNQPTGSNRYVIEWDGALIGLVKDQSLVELAASYQAQYLEILKQIDEIAQDTHIRGLHLLLEENLKTDFNEDRSSFLLTDGIDATSQGLGLLDEDFRRERTLTTTVENIKEAKCILRLYSTSLATDLSIITTRQTFTNKLINNHTAGADDLTIADQSQKGAEILALQTRQQLQATALSLSNENTVLRLFS